MKAPYPVVLQRQLPYTLLLYGWLIWPACSFSQTSVTAIYTSHYNAVSGLTYTLNGAVNGNLDDKIFLYKYGTDTLTTGNFEQLDSFTAGGLTYQCIKRNPVIKFRRVDGVVTGNSKTLFFERVGTYTEGLAVAMKPSYEDSLELLFDRFTFNIGIDNVFHNVATTNNNNIERVDVLFPNGIIAADATKAGFAVFDRGAGNGHDGFKIAAVKKMDVNNDPSAYFAIVTVTSGNYGNIGSSTSLDYHVTHKDDTDPYIRLHLPNQTQNRDGVFITFADLGIANNTVVYGYSLIPPDFPSGNVANLVDYNNATYYPRNSDLSGGGIDLIAAHGLSVTSTTLVVLPVHWQYLRANTQHNRVQLSWKLSDASPADRLVPERSSDGIHFTPVGASFSSSQETWWDEHPLPGDNYYRLGWVHTGIEPLYSSIVKVQVTHPAVLHVYPVPVQHFQFTVSTCDLTAGTYYLQLLDINNSMIYRQPVTAQQLCNYPVTLPSHTAHGIYHLQLLDNSGQKLATKTISL